MLLLHSQNCQECFHNTTLFLLWAEEIPCSSFSAWNMVWGTWVLSIYYCSAFILLTFMVFPQSILGVIVQWDDENFPLDICTPSLTQNYNSPWFLENKKGQLNQFKLIVRVLLSRDSFIPSFQQFGHSKNAIVGKKNKIHVFVRD